MKGSASTTLAVFILSTAIAHAANPICGRRGYDTHTEGYVYYHPVKLADCGRYCKQDKNCLSLSYGRKECNLYTVSVASNLEPVSDSPFIFYDAACTGNSSVSTSSSTAGTSTTSLKTTTSSTTRTSSKASTTTTKSAILSQSTTTNTKTTTKASTVSSKATSSSESSSTSKASSNSKPSNTSISSSTSKSSSTTSKFSSTSMSSSTSKSSSTTSKSSSTTSKSSAKSSSTTSAASTPPCPLPTFTVSNFVWFNSSHNAACAANRPDVGDGTGCLDENGDWCDPNLDKNCKHCGIGVCFTGLPTQPVGYGPPDYVKADVSSIGDCYQSDPGTTPRRAVGDGEVVRCGGSAYQMSFLGDSNVAKSVAYFTFQNQYYCPDTKAYFMAYGSGNTSMSCTYDSGRNATCLLNKPSFDVAASRFDNVGYYN